MGKQFEVGKQYFGRFICNADTTHTITIVRRTAKTAWINDSRGSNRRLKIHEYDWGDRDEYVMPFGTYSMAMLIGADKAVMA